MSMLSLSAAAAVSGYSTDTIRRWIKGGLVEASKGPTSNSPWKVDQASLQRLLADGAAEGRTGSAAISVREPIHLAVARWRTTVEDWNDQASADDLTEEQKREALLALEGLGSGGTGLIVELENLVERLKRSE